ncbi:MAG: DUF1080 domain-containing protein [Arenibacter sp.]|nr:DUF1080 domain-containing protein [Arenibacter sp.]
MKYKLHYVLLLVASLAFFNTVTSQDTQKKDGWIALFNGKNLEGWKVGENAGTFSVENGAIKVAGPKAHLFYMGEVQNHHFKNFEFKASVMTRANSNSGIYIHTRYQEDGWPIHGYEVQVNNSHGDWKRTGSLYDVLNIMETYAKDDEWYTEYIKVEGNRIIVKINDIVVVDYTEPANPKREGERVHRILKGGTFALQGHDPKSVVYFKDIMVRPLP